MQSDVNEKEAFSVLFRIQDENLEYSSFSVAAVVDCDGQVLRVGAPRIDGEPMDDGAALQLQAVSRAQFEVFQLN